ncbi:hypothetical protein M9458_027292, partial [Cirrhinus mrigala]
LGQAAAGVLHEGPPHADVLCLSVPFMRRGSAAGYLAVDGTIYYTAEQEGNDN